MNDLFLLQLTNHVFFSLTELHKLVAARRRCAGPAMSLVERSAARSRPAAAAEQFVYDHATSSFRLAADVARERQEKAERAERKRAQQDACAGARGATSAADVQRDQVLYDAKTSRFYPRGGSAPGRSGSEGDGVAVEEAESVTARRIDAERKRQDAER